jgi:hypothetical protein
MKEITKTFYRCDVCDTEHKTADDAITCEQFCHIIDAMGNGKIDPDKFSMSEKRKSVKELMIVFRKLWDEGGSHRKYYVTT